MTDSVTPENPLVPPLVPLAAILAGQPHAPVVYFARVSGGVKIGWTANLAQRMHGLYVPVAGVLAVVPGGRAAENAFHKRFAAWKVDDGRDEVFDIEHLLTPALEAVGPATRRPGRWAKRPYRAPGNPRPIVDKIDDRAILAMLARDEGTSSRELGAALGRSHTTARRRLRPFEEAGLAELVGSTGSSRRFRITAAGRAVLAGGEEQTS